MMNKVLGILFCFTVLLSCKKENSEPEPVAPSTPNISYISSNLYPLLFDTNSYWIYNNGIIQDSVSVSSIASHIGFVSQNGTDAEIFTINYASTQHPNYSEKILGAIITRGWIDDGWVYATNMNVGSSSQNITLIEIIDSLVINGQTYYNVSKVGISQGPSISDDMNFYYCDYVGVIRKEILSGMSILETWDLVQSDVYIYPY